MDSGLENVIAAETGLSDVKGDIGTLIIAGWYVGKLAASMAYEDVAHLLWHSAFEDFPTTQALGDRLGTARQQDFEALPDAGPEVDIIQYLRMGWDKQQDDESLDTAVRLAGWGVVFTAAALPLGRRPPPLPPGPAFFFFPDLF